MQPPLSLETGLSLCWLHIPHCWKAHVAAHFFIVNVGLWLFSVLISQSDMLVFQKKSSVKELYYHTCRLDRSVTLHASAIC